MSCKSCSTGGCGSVKDGQTSGCNNNGACGTGGCNKMNVFDWLSNMDVPATMRYNVVEIKFKGGRKEYFRNANNLELYTGDFVVCEMPTGYHIGAVSLQGELVRLQMLKRNVKDNDDIKVIVRKANEKDMEKHEQAINRDVTTMYRTRVISKDLKLQMKLSDVEFQSDNTKATFYYSAEDRVDFRELIKLLASEFKIRVEMKQISLRQEAARVGGIGSCGRELCCSTWLTDFKNIPTSAARYQNLSLNPTKLSGQCGRLKCCLNYELDTYMDALSGVPQVEKPLLTQKGKAFLQKTDIFRKLMWFSYMGDANWNLVTIEQVKEIQKLNDAGQQPRSLDDLGIEAEVDLKDKNEPINADLIRMDKKYANNKKPNQQKNKPRPQDGNRPPQTNPNQLKPQGNNPQQPKPQGNNPQQPKPQGNNPQQPKPQGNNPQQPKPQGNSPQQPRPQENNPQQPQANIPQQAKPEVQGEATPNAERPAGQNKNKNRNKNRNKNKRPPEGLV